MSPMLTRIKESATMHTDDLLISVACGVVFAVLTVAFFL